MMASNREREPLLNSVNSNASSEHFYGINLNSQRVRIQTLRLGMFPGILILFLVLLERIGYYSLASNLYLFLSTRYGWQYSNALVAFFIFSGTSYLSSLFGGWLSDAYLGRFKTIGFAFILFTVPYWFIAFITDFYPNTALNFTNLINASNPYPQQSLVEEEHSAVLILILVFAAIGTGTIKANIAPFGAEQVRLYGADFLKLYLNWLYWCVNIGAFVAILGITYVQQNGINEDMKEDSFKIGYIIAAVCLTVATTVFWFTFPIYFNQPLSGSPISRTFAVLKEAWKLNRNKASEISSLGNINRPSWLDQAKVRFGGKYHESVVEDVKALSTIVTVFLTLIPYWILYFQMQSTYQAQGLKLRLGLEKDQFEIPAAWLMLFNVIFLIIFIPLMNKVIYPFLSRKGIEISMFIRIPFGMVCAAMSMLIAGILEWKRIHCDKTIYQTIDKVNYTAADISILWQIPQYSLVGISEVFTSVSGLEFACSQAPSTMQGAVMGLYYFCNGLGNFLGIAAVEIYNKYIMPIMIKNNYVTVDDDDVNISYYFWFLATLQVISLIIFCCLSKNLKIRKPHSVHESNSVLQNDSSRILPVG